LVADLAGPTAAVRAYRLNRFDGRFRPRIPSRSLQAAVFSVPISGRRSHSSPAYSARKRPRSLSLAECDSIRPLPGHQATIMLVQPGISVALPDALCNSAGSVVMNNALGSRPYRMSWERGSRLGFSLAGEANAAGVRAAVVAATVYSTSPPGPGPSGRPRPRSGGRRGPRRSGAPESRSPSRRRTTSPGHARGRARRRPAARAGPRAPPVLRARGSLDGERDFLRRAGAVAVLGDTGRFAAPSRTIESCATLTTTDSTPTSARARSVVRHRRVEPQAPPVALPVVEDALEDAYGSRAPRSRR
jgi:hypothetical protein